MKRAIIIFLLLLCFSFKILLIPAIAISQPLTKGFYKVENLKLSPGISYTVQNPSFSERIYVIIFDSHATPLQGIRVKPQSKKFNLIPLQPGYKFVLIGDGEVIIS
ncbi:MULTISPECIES: hypothetical protein [unclassified Clostridium]|uniref:hypothetical protein n=1 Tax=unclassified Clostridium TaxID=2614128 RepID=UPI0002985810|nr:MULTISPECIES: hypothetical protein [unclassified Clostridium]EKQ54370.1 MAG: hypothetical protein A370_03193 [Clostridium sp. Maddingley MBC34-26]